MFHRLIWLTWLIGLALLPRRSQAMQCQPIDIEMCKQMPYNMTRMPNLLHHSTQGNANLALEQYQQLVDTHCSKDLVFFLCSVFAPICNTHFRQEAIPPCRDVCQKARDGCEPTMLRYNVSWPSQLDCRQYPLYDRGVCISPKAIESGPGQGEPDRQVTSSALTTKIVIDMIPNCPCKNSKTKIKKKTYAEKKFHYAIKATFISAQGLIGGPLIITIYVSEVLKKTNIVIPTEANITLWADSDCICPKLEGGKEYLILGFQHDRRLLFDDSCMALPWKKKWTHRIKSWEKKLNSRRRPKPANTLEPSTTTRATTTTTTTTTTTPPPTTTTTTTTTTTPTTTSTVTSKRKPTRKPRVKPKQSSEKNRQRNRKRKGRRKGRKGGSRTRHEGHTAGQEESQKPDRRLRTSRRRQRKQPS